MNLINSIVLFSIVYSMIVNLLAYAVVVPSEYFAYSTDLTTVSQQTESLYKNTIGIPVLDIGGVIFYTGNIVLDFLMNFVTAVPSIVTLLLDIFFRFFPINSNLVSTFKLSVYTMLSVIMVIALIRLVLSIRTRGAII